MDFKWPEGKKMAISLSFDDARVSQADIGLPILDKYGVKATFYVMPDRVKEKLDAWQKAMCLLLPLSLRPAEDGWMRPLTILLTVIWPNSQAWNWTANPLKR